MGVGGSPEGPSHLGTQKGMSSSHIGTDPPGGNPMQFNRGRGKPKNACSDRGRGIFMMKNTHDLAARLGSLIVV